MKKHIILGLAPFLMIACDARVNTAAPAPEKVIEKNTTTIVNPPAATTSEKTTTTTTETKK
jgi:hypothetical protein